MKLAELRTAIVHVQRVDARCRQCSRCAFWLGPEVEHCPDCGLPRESRAAAWLRSWFPVLGAGICATAAVATVAFAPAPAVIAFCVGGAVGGFLLGVIGARAMAALRERRRVTGLDDTVRNNRRELADIQKWERRLLDSRSAVVDDVVERDRDAALAMLDAKLKLRRAERDLLIVQSWRVTFERWVNCLAPLVEDLGSLTWEEIDRRRLVVEQLYDAGRVALERWKRELDEADGFARAFLQRVESVLSSVRDLRSTLAMRKGQLADPGASEIKSARSDAVSADLTEILTSVASVREEASTSIDDELERLRAERDVERLLGEGG